MRKRLLIAVAAAGLIIYAVLTAISFSVRLEFNFCEGVQGWEAGFAEYAPDMEDMQL
jgi:hypothetical protein